MQVFVPLTEVQDLAAISRQGWLLVPYRCGMQLLHSQPRLVSAVAAIEVSQVIQVDHPRAA